MTARPRHLYWCRSHHAAARSTDCCRLLWCSAATSQHPTFYHLRAKRWSSPLCCPGCRDYGKCYIGWLSVNLLNRLQSVLNACSRCSVGCWSATIRPETTPLTDALASFHWLRAHLSESTDSHCVPSSSWHCISVFVWSTVPRCWRPTKTLSPVVDL